MSLPAAKTVDLEVIEIAYREMGQGPALMFVHGLGGGSAAWSAQFESFSDRYRVIAWDAPGYGGSADFSMDTPMVRDYVDVLARFLYALGVETVHLVGHSFGGIIIAAYNRRFPGRVLSLTLLQAVTGSNALARGRLQDLVHDTGPEFRTGSSPHLCGAAWCVPLFRGHRPDPAGRPQRRHNGILATLL